MRLQAYLDETNLSHAAFGRLLADPPVPRVSVRQWAMGLRFPSNPEILLRIEAATAGRVTSADIADHVSERRREADASNA